MRGGTVFFTALHYAVYNNHFDVAQWLIKMGANVNCKSLSPPPLHYAAKAGNLAIVQLLVENNAKVKAKDLGMVRTYHIKLLIVEAAYKEVILK